MSQSENTQQALFLEAKQGDFRIGTRHIPKPGEGELLVKIIATSLNPVDWKVQKYGIFVTKYPVILGGDVAGVVEVVGEGVTNFKQGDRVFFQGVYEDDYAAFQQYALATAVTTAKIPDKHSFEEASTIPIALTAAYVGLYNNKPHGLQLSSPIDVANRGKYKGTPFVVLGGSSSVGQYVIQLAKLSGFNPIITTASPKHIEHLTTIGATHVLDRKQSPTELHAKIEKLTATPIEIVYDAISSQETQTTGRDLLLATKGRLVTVTNLSISKTEDFEHIQVVGILRLPQNQELLHGLYDNLTQLVEEGSIKPNRYELLPNGLQGIAEGLKSMENDKVSGVKLVAQPWGAA